MPDPKQMSGIPRPVDDLPDGAVSVRVVRGTLSNNLTNQSVDLHVGSDVRTAKTDENGRAQFSDLPPGATLKAVTVVDGERLESLEFPTPSQGGIRLILAATDKSAKSGSASAAAVPGSVVLGSDSRIIFDQGDETVRLYYLLDFVNAAQAPVNPPTPIMFDLPTGAVGASVVQGSPQANINGTRVRVQGPFAPGSTRVEIACEIPVLTGTLHMTQRFPVVLEQLVVIVKKMGETSLASPQIARQQEVTNAEVQTFIAGAGGPVSAGEPIELTLAGLPHHSTAPRWTALSIAGVIVVIGIWASRRPDQTAARAAERRRLAAQRDKLFNDLVRLEVEHRSGRGNQVRYPARREELIAALEQVYGALEGDESGPEPADRAGLAA